MTPRDRVQTRDDTLSQASWEAETLMGAIDAVIGDPDLQPVVVLEALAYLYAEKLAHLAQSTEEIDVELASLRAITLDHVAHCPHVFWSKTKEKDS